MRFRQLSLERFGRFEGCDIGFRAGTPDLHIVYGANEAGKTTSMAAVSDLLFGFERSSRYGFLFEYPLLRVGAVLEEDGRTFAVRRRKGNAGSLVDAADKAIDEAPLIAMLHGQTRDSFRLAFSLDHLRLREGGRAIVQAKDDVGQALFAAGSGMTGVTTMLAAIEAEADGIWGARASQKRTYTQAERTYTESQKVARERQVRPKAWSDAHAALAEAEAARAQAEARRDAFIAEQRQLERLRRIGPAMQRRADLLVALSADQEVLVLAPAREERILGALAAAERAERERVAAATLLAETQERFAALPADPFVLAAADAIEALVERRGAIAKADGDADRLAIERRIQETRIAELRRDVGMAEQDLPPRPLVARLRDLARTHGEAQAALRSIGEMEEELRARLAPLERRMAGAALTEGLTDLAAAVDAARRLGDEVDTRCAALATDAHDARTAATLSLARLTPWSGDAEALARLPGVGEQEIAAAEAEFARCRDAARMDAEEAQRLTDEGARLALDRVALAESGRAVSEADVAEARQVRGEHWRGLRDALRGRATLADPEGASDAYERLADGADTVADRRFAFAADSGKLGLLDTQAVALDLRRVQAEARRDAAEAAVEAARAGWRARLEQVGLPALPPARLRGWLADRTSALDAQARADLLVRQAEAEAARRAQARGALLALMPDAANGEEALAPVLREGERRRAAGEAQDKAYRDSQAEARQLGEALEAQARQARHRKEERDRAERAWQAALSPLQLTLDIAEGDARLSLIEELRAGSDAVSGLSARLRSIEAERARFATDLTALWTNLAMEAEPALDRLRARLAEARSVAGTITQVEADHRRWAAEVETAAAGHAAAMASLAPVLAELQVAPGALDGAVQASRRVREAREALAAAEAEILRGGEGHALVALEEQWRVGDPDAIAVRADALVPLIAAANAEVARAADAAGEARRAFSSFDLPDGDAAGAQADAEQARAEMAAQAENYLLKRAQALTLRWAIERYRRERQDPLLDRAGALFRRLTLGRYRELRIDYAGDAPRLLGLRDDGRQAIDVEAMSDGTTDQLFLALRLAAAEQSVASGVRLPFLADDLFINFDDDRARAGFEVLAELAATTQVLFFTHHAHLAAIARDVVGAELHSECALA